MKLLIMSDLHTEFGSNYLDIINKELDFDVLVLAGDISIYGSNVKVIQNIAKYIFPKKLFYVTGNHDYYYGTYDIIDDLIDIEYIESNFKLLNNQVVECDSNGEIIYFIGATGWQSREDYNVYNYPLMNDFRNIKGHSDSVVMYGEIEKKFLEDELTSLKDKKVVVVTHIPPTAKAIDFNSPESNKPQNYIKAYYNDWDDLIEKHEPNLWICGHLHDSYDTIVGKTRIVRNAYGYEGHRRNNIDVFNKNFIIEI